MVTGRRKGSRFCVLGKLERARVRVLASWGSWNAPGFEVLTSRGGWNALLGRQHPPAAPSLPLPKFSFRNLFGGVLGGQSLFGDGAQFISRLVEQYQAEPFGAHGFRHPMTMTREDRQRLRKVNGNPSACQWYNLARGDELECMTYTTLGERKWKRMGLLVKLFLRHADTGFVVMAHPADGCKTWHR